MENRWHVQKYTCESGEDAAISIPENATRDDILGIKELLNVIAVRKFKITEDEDDGK